MIGIVVVSHSVALASAALELAAQMVHGDGPRVALAAGTADGGLGTDAVRVAAAIDDVAGADGVLVFVDLGSAVLSTELALELRGSDAPVRLTSAPLVEGLVAALVAAGAGGSLDAVAAEAEKALAPKLSHLAAEAEGAQSAVGGAVSAARAGAVGASGVEGEPNASARILLVNAAGLHARPAAMLAAALGGLDAAVSLRNLRTGNVVADASSMSSLLTLDARGGDELDVTAAGADAAAAVAEIERLASDGFGEGAAPENRDGGGVAAEALSAEPSDPEKPSTAARGDVPTAAEPDAAPLAVGVSLGVAVGPVVRLAPAATEPEAGAPVPEAERAEAAASVIAAFDAVRDGLERRAARLTDPRFADARAVLAATAALAGDRVLAERAERRVSDAGLSPARAAWETLSAFAAQLSAQGGLLAERAGDVRDLRGRVVAHLVGTVEPGLPDRSEPFVLVADELGPADAALLGTTPCVGVVMATGGPTSHPAIIVRSLGLAAVVSPRAKGLVDGVTVLLDGTSGELVESPSAARVAQASAHSVAPPFSGAGATADGHRVALLVNVGGAAGAEQGARLQAEGVGLFRTEFVFLDRNAAPSGDEQVAAYRPVFAAFAGRPVVVRTLDAGSDKPLAFLPQAPEPNPALGVRGIRAARTAPRVLDEQLEAIARAAAAERADVSVMAPMIATFGEAQMFAEAARAHGITRVGAMIETPAAALVATELFDVLDFVSIGTNDLAQYTLAADRELAALAELNDPWQPALLRLIRLVGAAGSAADKPVSICGEAAADPALAPVLVGLGATSLSIRPNALGAVAAALGAVTHAQCVAAGTAAAGAVSPTQARAAAAAVLG